MRVEIDGKFYRMRRGKLVPIPEKWLNNVTTPATIRQRPSKLPRKIRRYDVGVRSTSKLLACTRFKDRRDDQIDQVQEQPGDRCYAPSCGCWDGNPECTCKRLQNSD